MKALDDNFGRGAGAALRAALTPPGYRTELSVFEYEGGVVEVTAHWIPADAPAGEANAASGTVTFRDGVMSMPAWDLRDREGTGISTWLLHTVPPVVRKWGIGTARITALASPDPIPFLLKCGFVEAEHDVFSCDISQVSRIEQYGAWKAGKASEPDWHRRRRGGQ